MSVRSAAVLAFSGVVAIALLTTPCSPKDVAGGPEKAESPATRRSPGSGHPETGASSPSDPGRASDDAEDQVATRPDDRQRMLRHARSVLGAMIPEDDALRSEQGIVLEEVLASSLEVFLRWEDGQQAVERPGRTSADRVLHAKRFGDLLRLYHASAFAVFSPRQLAYLLDQRPSALWDVDERLLPATGIEIDMEVLSPGSRAAVARVLEKLIARADRLGAVPEHLRSLERRLSGEGESR